MSSTANYSRRAEALAAACQRARPEVPWLTPAEFLQRSQEERWTIVDVRSPVERSVSMIPGAVSKEQFEAHLNEYAIGRILVYCTVGCRSGAYAEALREGGLTAFNLRGGVLAWAFYGRPFVKPDGKPTRRVHVHGQQGDVLPPGYEAAW